MGGTRGLLRRLTGVLAWPLTSRCGLEDRRALPAIPVVILGAPIGNGAEPSIVLTERVHSGVDLYLDGRASCVLVTGTPAEAAAMRELALSRGVPESDLIVDPDAGNTYENARNAAALLRPRGATRVWVATQPFHTRRACFWFRRHGLDALPWWSADSVQYRRPRKAARWIAREYLSWLVVATQLLRRRRRHRPHEDAPSA